jgi:hypothetical protein
MAEENRRRAVAETLRPLLEEGEAYDVYCHEGEIFVTEAGTSLCAERHPRVYGRLLALHAELEQAGSAVARLPMLIALTFCVGLNLGWWTPWLGPDTVEKLNRFWFYLLVFYVVFQLWGLITGAAQRQHYQRQRDDLLALLAEEHLDRDVLLSLIEGDEAVSRAAHYLKLDADAVRLASGQSPDERR